MPIIIEKGNLLEKDFDMIGHQTNCLGVMGAGIAKQIKDKWPEVFKKYHGICATEDDPHSLLGKVYYVHQDGGPIVANMFGEFSFTENAEGVIPGTKRHTDYSALQKCFEDVKLIMKANHLKTFGIPDHIGCGLAGGDWYGVVMPMIVNLFKDEEDLELHIIIWDGTK